MPDAARAAAVDRLRPYVDEACRFTGWHFEQIAPKPAGLGLPWSYPQRAAALLQRASSVLDLGTGGGELFADLRKAYRGRATATESWRVNVPIAKGRLWPLGVEVVRASSLQLPFQDGAFDLVLDRHEELDPAEVGRVLRPGGSVLTQQVGRNDWQELRPFFPRMQDDRMLFEEYASGFQEAGLTTVRAESRDILVAYRSLGDIVFMLCVAPWTIPDFDPLEADLDALLAFEHRQATEDGIVLTESRFVIEARRPGSSPSLLGT